MIVVLGLPSQISFLEKKFFSWVMLHNITSQSDCMILESLIPQEEKDMWIWFLEYGIRRSINWDHILNEYFNFQTPQSSTSIMNQQERVAVWN